MQPRDLLVFCFCTSRPISSGPKSFTPRCSAGRLWTVGRSTSAFRARTDLTIISFERTFKDYPADFASFLFDTEAIPEDRSTCFGSISNLRGAIARQSSPAHHRRCGVRRAGVLRRHVVQQDAGRPFDRRHGRGRCRRNSGHYLGSPEPQSHAARLRLLRSWWTGIAY